MQSFFEIVEKIKKLKGLTHDYEVAELLNIKPKTMAASKTRKSVPLKKITAFCNKEKISIDELLTGNEIIYKDTHNQINGAQIIKEVSGDYPEIKISEALRMCSAVLESKTSYAVALYHNLVHFDRVVKNENLYNQCHDDLISVNKSLSEMRTRMDEVEESNKKLRNEMKKLRDISGDSAPTDLSVDHAAPTGTDDKET
ncbi:MAG: helix-turn-helix domain-containing protein [Smithella sp.]